MRDYDCTDYLSDSNSVVGYWSLALGKTRVGSRCTARNKRKVKFSGVTRIYTDHKPVCKIRGNPRESVARLSHAAEFPISLHEFCWPSGQALDSLRNWGMRGKEAPEAHPQERLDDE